MQYLLVRNTLMELVVSFKDIREREIRFPFQRFFSFRKACFLTTVEVIVWYQSNLWRENTDFRALSHLTQVPSMPFWPSSLVFNQRLLFSCSLWVRSFLFSFSDVCSFSTPSSEQTSLLSLALPFLGRPSQSLATSPWDLCLWHLERSEETGWNDVSVSKTQIIFSLDSKLFPLHELTSCWFLLSFDSTLYSDSAGHVGGILFGLLFWRFRMRGMRIR